MTEIRAFSLAALAAAGLLSACARDYVKVDDMALGRVVVYRNGVAYFERKARLEGDELELSVPQGLVNDFLKSLTVKDAETGRSLPVSFPSQGTEHDGMVEMTIRLPERPSTEVILSYITEAPAWKPSYRVSVGEDGSVRLEGWAIVDNTSGESWKEVVVGVGSSSALSFRYDLWSIRNVHRQTLATEDRFAVAPPSGGSPYANDGGATLAELGDEDINRPETHPDRGEVLARDAPAAEAYSSGAGATSAAKDKMAKKRAEEARRRREADLRRRQQNQQRLQKLAQSLRQGGRKIVIEGYAAANETDPKARALDRANLLRNQLIDQGVPPAQLEVRAVGAQEGRPAGVRLVAEASGDQEKASEALAAPVGESYFQSDAPITVRRGTSVMVSIVDGDTEGELVYLYDPESERGNRRYAFKAVRFANPTEHSLESGPVTVFGQGGFIGEGLAEPIPPGELALVPFALDRQVVVEDEISSRDRISRLVKLERGVLTTEVAHLKKTAYRLKNRSREPVTVYVRHTVERGWKLTGAPKRRERLGRAYLFPVELGPGETRRLAVEQATPLERTLDLASPTSLELVRVYLENASDHPQLREPMEKLLALHREMANQEQAIDGLRVRLGDFRTRLDELHAQIVSLKKARSGGRLVRHLGDKMEEISARVQRATIELVERQEKLLLARIRFQDAVAELSLSGEGGGDSVATSETPGG